MGDINNSSAWQEKVSRKKAQQFSTIEPFLTTSLSAFLIEEITKISDIEELADKIAKREWKSEEVIGAYIQKAIQAHQKTNCITEALFPTAIQRARELDVYIQENGKPIGPLHGIPITLKDQFDVEGVDSTIGYVGRTFQPAKKDAVIVKLLKDLGAVVLAKSNLPQSIMWCETDNPLWGLTVNPRDPDFTCGGSSGGEGALLAQNASILGWGTDIGGSIRIPSHINGLYGLKPSSARFPYQGVPVSTEGQEHVPSSIGPMTRSLSSLTSITKAVINAEPWNEDPRLSPVQWRQNLYEEIQSRPLVIGVMYDDGVVKVHPPIERVLKEFVEKLKLAGHEIVEWDPSLHAECVEIMDKYYTADGGEDIRRAVLAGGEPFIPHVERLINKGKPISVYEYWQLNKAKLEAQKKYLDKWNAVRSVSGKPVDILLTPAMPHAAVPHKGCRWVGYTKVWNVLDYSALVFPAGEVDKERDHSIDHIPRNEMDEWNWKIYDAVKMHGHPVGLQVIGRRFDEERILGATKVLEGCR